MADEHILGLFYGKDTPDVHTVRRLYQKGLDYNNQINLDNTVQSNENFYIGK